MSLESGRAPCLRCGALLHYGDARICMSFSLPELAELAVTTIDPKVRDRLLCAIGMLDEDLEDATRAEIAVTREQLDVPTVDAEAPLEDDA